MQAPVMDVETFARVGAAIGMRVEDVPVQGRRTWIRLHEKGGKVHECLAITTSTYLHAYIEQAGLLVEGKGWLFRSAIGRAGQLSKHLRSSSAWRRGACSSTGWWWWGT